MSEIKLKKGQYVIGIDLGTTNSAVSCIDFEGKQKIIFSEIGANTTPSVVNFNKSGKDEIVTVGSQAKNRITIDGLNTIYEIKRLIGKDFKDINKSNFAYSIVDQKGVPCVKTEQCGIKSPIEISAKILMALTRDVMRVMQCKLDDILGAVITVPAYFNQPQRSDTKTAGEIAGLKVLRIINEPTSAAIAYGYDKKKDGTILVFDLGGGTFDVSILEINQGVLEVKATNGNNNLGGANFDEKIMNYLIEDIERDSGVILRNTASIKSPLKESDRQAIISRLKELSENIKISLSGMSQVTVNLPFLFQKPDGTVYSYTRKNPFTVTELNKLTQDLVDMTMSPVKQCLKDSQLSINQIDSILLVGGMTRMPAVKDAVKNFFGKEPNSSVNPDEVVAVGASLQAAMLCELSIDNQIGNELTLLDITPLNFGIETQGGVLTILVEKNMTIPTKKSQIFTTAADNQSAVNINIYQGERPFAKDNKFLGQFDLHGIPPARRGVPQIEVTFNIDVNGILEVTAVDKTSGIKQSTVINNATNVSKEEIERLRREAEEFREKDEQRRKSVEVINQADNMCLQHPKVMEQYGDKIPAELKETLDKIIKEIESTVGSVKDRDNAEDFTIAELERKMEEYKNESLKIYESMKDASGATQDQQNSENA